MKCPQCGLKLEPVPPSRHLNREQWDATKAGDYFREANACEGGEPCPVNRLGANGMYRYARDRDLEAFNDREAAAGGWN